MTFQYNHDVILLFSVANVICISIVNARELTRVIQLVFIYSY